VFYVAGALVTPHSHTGRRPGEWLVALGLGEHSSPTWVDACLSIDDLTQPPPTPDPKSVPSNWSTTLRGPPQPPRYLRSGTYPLLVSIPIKTGGHQISPTGPTREVVVSLASDATLQNK
jgi:hypothetical protein